LKVAAQGGVPAATNSHAKGRFVRDAVAPRVLESTTYRSFRTGGERKRTEKVKKISMPGRKNPTSSPLFIGGQGVTSEFGL